MYINIVKRREKTIETIIRGTVEYASSSEARAPFFYVEGSAGLTMIVEGGITLTSGEWRDWIKALGPK
jgi:hypothetical protein